MTSRSSDFLERTVGLFRSVWQRAGRRDDSADALLADIDPDLPDDQIEVVRTQIDDALYGAPGELMARAKAARLAERYLLLSPTGQQRFLLLLAVEYGPHADELETALDSWKSGDTGTRGRAEADMREALRSPRARLLQRFTSLEHGVKFVVDLRAEVRTMAEENDDLAAFDAELLALLTEWFDFGFLTLERITWEQSPAEVLERLIDYETVHEITSWDDLRNRLGPDRLLYAFFHPRMPNEPVIFVEVALTSGIATSIEELLDEQAPDTDPFESDTAVFYSINNCHTGLVGVPLGDFLIKKVVEELRGDLPHLTRFVTLSPVPGFRAWLEQVLDPDFESDGPTLDEVRRRALRGMVSRENWHLDLDSTEMLKEPLLRLAAQYLLTERRGLQAHDRVANFHLRNGARLERINWLANQSPAGISLSAGLMVNYRYEPDFIEENHEAYTTRGEVVASAEVRDLLD